MTIFTDRDKKRIDELLTRIHAIIDIDWRYEMDDEREVLVVTGIYPTQDAFFTSWRTAIAGLEMWLCGYNEGKAQTMERVG